MTAEWYVIRRHVLRPDKAIESVFSAGCRSEAEARRVAIDQGATERDGAVTYYVQPLRNLNQKESA